MLKTAFDNSVNPAPTPINTLTHADNNEDQGNLVENDINYSYSIQFLIMELVKYFRKRIDDKEIFTLIKDGIMTDYAIFIGN